MLSFITPSISPNGRKKWQLQRTHEFRTRETKKPYVRRCLAFIIKPKELEDILFSLLVRHVMMNQHFETMEMHRLLWRLLRYRELAHNYHEWNITDETIIEVF